MSDSQNPFRLVIERCIRRINGMEQEPGKLHFFTQSRCALESLLKLLALVANEFAVYEGIDQFVAHRPNLLQKGRVSEVSFFDLLLLGIGKLAEHVADDEFLL